MRTPSLGDLARCLAVGTSVLAGALSLPAVEVIKIQPAPPSDEALAREVARIITGRPGVDTHRVRVEAHEGRLRLSGEVPDLHSRAEAERLALGVRGIASVENLITIDTAEIPDSLLQLNSLRALEASPRLRTFGIQVSVAGAALTLAGEVPLARDRLEAEKLASRVRGLQSLDNQIRVAPTPIDPDVLRRRIEKLLGNRRVFGGVEDLMVSVDEGGVVTLGGFSPSHVDRLRAERLAYGLRGVTEVRNDIQVRRPPADPP